MASKLFLSLALAALLPGTGVDRKPDGLDERKESRFFEKIRVLGVELGSGEVTVIGPEGKSRTWLKGDRIIEENAVLEKVTRSLLVFTRNVEGPNGGSGEVSSSSASIRRVKRKFESTRTGRIFDFLPSSKTRSGLPEREFQARRLEVRTGNTDSRRGVR